MQCRHCQTAPPSRPRGLCWVCYYTPAIRDRYPSTSKFAHRGVGIHRREAAPPAWPTKAMPGSPEKVEVLEQRARLGQQLWHPHDARVGW